MIQPTTHGRCLCGSVEYTAAGDPNWSSHCHCPSCRRHTGSAVASFVSFAVGGFSVTKGALTDFESSPGVTRSFCNACGTPMTYRTTQLPDEVHVFLGTLVNPEDYPAQVQVFCAHKLPWLSLDDHLPSFETLPG